MKSKIFVMMMAILMVSGFFVSATTNIEPVEDFFETVSDNDENVDARGEERCEIDIEDAEDHAEDQDVCPAEISNVECPHDEDFVHKASGCELHYLLDIGWERTEFLEEETYRLDVSSDNEWKVVTEPGEGSFEFAEGERIDLGIMVLPTKASFQRWVSEDVEIEDILEEDPTEKDNSLEMPGKDISVQAEISTGPDFDLFSIDLETDRDIYELDNEIEINITAEGEKTLNFNTGCQAEYRIYRKEGLEKVFDLSEGRMCTQALTEAELPETWSFNHNLSENRLDEGTYLIRGGPIGYGYSEKEIEISTDEATVGRGEDFIEINPINILDIRDRVSSIIQNLGNFLRR